MDAENRINEYVRKAAERYPEHITLLDRGERTRLSIDVHRDALRSDDGLMSLLVCILKEVKRLGRERGKSLGIHRVFIEGEGTYMDVYANVGDSNG
jgi:hypothetical protein